MKKESVTNILKFSFRAASQQPVIIVPLLAMVATFIIAVIIFGIVLLAIGVDAQVLFGAVGSIAAGSGLGLPTLSFMLLSLNPALLGLLGVVGLAILAGAIALLAYFGIGLFSMAQDISSGKKTSLKAMKRNSRKFFWRYIGVYVLVGLISSVASILVFSLIGLTASTAGTGSISTVVATVLGVLAIFLFLLFFVLSPYYLISQNMKVIDSIKKSFKVVKREYPFVLGITVTFAVLNFVLDPIPAIGGILTFLLVPIKVIAYMRFALGRK